MVPILFWFLLGCIPIGLSCSGIRRLGFSPQRYALVSLLAMLCGSVLEHLLFLLLGLDLLPALMLLGFPLVWIVYLILH